MSRHSVDGLRGGGGGLRYLLYSCVTAKVFIGKCQRDGVESVQVHKESNRRVRRPAMQRLHSECRLAHAGAPCTTATGATVRPVAVWASRNASSFATSEVRPVKSGSRRGSSEADLPPEPVVTFPRRAARRNSSRSDSVRFNAATRARRVRRCGYSYLWRGESNDDLPGHNAIGTRDTSTQPVGVHQPIP